MKSSTWLVLVTIIFGFQTALWGGPLPQAPKQPSQGFGGAYYTNGAMRQSRIGAYDDKIYLFEPDQPRPAKAPVIFFFHGWSSSSPDYYLGWIEHLCRRGNIVVFPSYQGMGEPATKFTITAIRSAKEALSVLNDGMHVEPDRDRVAFIGHESGAAVAGNVAAWSRWYKLPWPKALFLLMPSFHQGGKLESGIERSNWSGIREGTLMLVAVGDGDRRNDEGVAREIFYGADNVRARDKNYLTFRTDLHGTPGLVADRWAPLCPKDLTLQLEIDKRRFEFIKVFPEEVSARAMRCQPIDAMDWLGFWKLFDSLTGAAFENQGRNLALGMSKDQRSMGFWSDGRPVKPIFATERP